LCTFSSEVIRQEIGVAGVHRSGGRTLRLSYTSTGPVARNRLFGGWHSGGRLEGCDLQRSAPTCTDVQRSQRAAKTTGGGGNLLARAAIKTYAIGVPCQGLEGSQK